MVCWRAKGFGSLKNFSKKGGIRLENSYWLSKNWQISTAFEYGEQRYNRRKHLNGNSYLWSNTLVYYPHSQQYWFGGLDYYRENAAHKTNAYDKKSLRLGWGQEWDWGVSSRLSLAYHRKNYKDIDFFSIRQKNNEYSAQLTLWHRNLHFWGITPKISWLYQKTDSNHPFYSYDKSRVFLEFSRQF